MCVCLCMYIRGELIYERTKETNERVIVVVIRFVFAVIVVVEHK